MAEVRIVTVYKCFNMNPQKLEQLLHNFFGKSCLSLDIFTKDGNRQFQGKLCRAFGRKSPHDICQPPKRGDVLFRIIIRCCIYFLRLFTDKLNQFFPLYTMR